MDGPTRDVRLDRRRLLAGVGATGVTALAGCLGVLTGDEPARFGASAATVPDSTLAATGYGHHRTSESPVTRTYEVAGQSRDVEATNVVAEYERAVEIPLVGRFRAAVFAALSTPQVAVLGETFNPVGEMSTDELLAMVQERYEALRDLRRESERRVTVLGEETRATRYAGTALLLGGDVRVEIFLTITEAVAAGGDFVLGIGAYPRVLDDRDEVTAMLESIRHEG
ncbi:DUF6517 family protein [Halomarina oriensis]|uniref:Uncharacterized protein n=1 Tax=Halomarina oriensis TaxID=671145 RepID=A0A6B0GQU2_9EURY|nr:DUF6517 family protein [Halomarina oriensis]MWG34495.1 hypothetical protein [Halomarina oriensis]